MLLLFAYNTDQQFILLISAIVYPPPAFAQQRRKCQPNRANHNGLQNDIPEVKEEKLQTTDGPVICGKGDNIVAMDIKVPINIENAIGTLKLDSRAEKGRKNR